MANTTIVGTLRTLLVAETTQFDEALKRSTAGAQAWAKDLGAIGTQAASVGQTVADKLTAPLATLGTTAQAVTTTVEASLGGMRGALEASHADVTKLGDAFKGVTAATPGPAMAGAVKGATDAVEGLGKAGTKAYDVFHGLGTDAPQQINKVGAAAKQASNDVGGIAGSFKVVAATVGVGFAVTQVIDFGKAIVEDAGHIADLSAKVGISAEAVQRFGFAASQTGASMDTITGAIGKMNVNLAGGDKSTVTALDQIGLSFKDVRAMKPEDAFAAIAQAIQQIPDPMLQAEAATKLFGKTGMELLPAINANLIDIGNSAKVMSDHTVEELDKAGDEWAKFVNNLKVSTAEFMVWSKENAPKYAFGVAGLAAQGAAALVKNTFDVVYGQKAVIADAATSLSDALEKVKDPMTGVGLAAKSTTGLLGDYGVIADQAKEKSDALAAAQKKSADAAEAHRAKIADLAATLSGVGVAQKVKDLDEATQLAVKTWGVGVLNAKDLVAQVKALGDSGVALTPVLMDVYRQHVQLTLGITGTVDAMKLLKNVGGDVAPILREQAAAAAELADKYKQVGKGTSGDANKLIGSLSALNVKPGKPPPVTTSWQSSMGTSLAASVPGALMSGFSAAKNKTGDAGKQIGAQLGGTLAQSATKSVVPAITKAAGKGLGQMIGGLAGNAIPIIGPIIGSVVGGLVDKAFSHKGRDATVAFADSMGGFDELHKKLGTLGAEGEQMWVKLTGVGKKDEKGAQKIIDDIGKAFEANDAKIAAEAQKAQERLQHLTDDFGSLQNSLQVFGGVAPASLRPMIAELQKMPGLTGEMQSTLAAISQDPSWQTMQQKAQDLGIDLAALGPKFQESKLTDVALGYARDLTMFSDAGADMTGVLAGMSDELSTLYQESKKNGVALPATLEPYMTQLAAMGKLVDENGDKVSNLNDVAFKDIEDKSLTDVVDVLKDIKDLLADALPKAASDGAAKIQDTFAKHPVTIPVVYGDPGNPPTPGAATVPPPPQIGLQGGTHGQFVDWGAGTDVTLHGKEAVVPYGQSAGAMNITVVSQLDGREVARNQVRYIPNELRRAGV
jgi:hypothetical protein